MAGERVKHIDLFSGIGGFSLACEWNGIETIGFVEMDKFCQQVLKKHWPDVPIAEDVNDVEEIKQIVANSTQHRDCDASLLLTAGFPCQPFSNAGRKGGASDDRYLWPQTLAVIEVSMPDWIVLENVAGLLGMVFPDSQVKVAGQASIFGCKDDDIADYNTITGGIDRDLKQAGYETVWLVIPACAIGAPHRRDRVWIVANRKRLGWQEGTREGIQPTEQESKGQDARNISAEGDAPHTSQQGLQGEQPREPLRYTGQLNREWRYEKPDWRENWFEVATRFCRVDARVSNRVDRLKALGNAIVPQVAYQILKGIKEYDKTTN